MTIRPPKPGDDDTEQPSFLGLRPLPGYVLDESQRQLVLLAIAELSLRRPGFEDALREVARALDGKELFNGFRVTSADLPDYRKER